MNLPLLRWLWHRSMPTLTVALAAPVALLYVLWTPGPPTGDWNDIWPFMAAFLFIVPHGVGTMLALAWFNRPAAGFLYTRGYTRDVIWSHTLAMWGLVVLAVWLPASLAVWTPLRSLVQDRMFENPNYPLMQPTEAMVPLVWLGIWFLTGAACYYGAIRSYQPTREEPFGSLLYLAAIIAAFVVLIPRSQPLAGWLIALIVAAGLVASVVLLAASRRLHRRMEVRS
jgi:hypothetical protein